MNKWQSTNQIVRLERGGYDVFMRVHPTHFYGCAVRLREIDGERIHRLGSGRLCLTAGIITAKPGIYLLETMGAAEEPTETRFEKVG
jgi:hypothetical protein